MVACMGERGRLALGMVSRMASWPQGGPSPWWLRLPVVRIVHGRGPHGPDRGGRPQWPGPSPWS